MGWLDKTVAATKLAASQARKAAASGKEAVQEKYAGESTYVDIREWAVRTGERTMEIKDQSSQIVSELVASAGATGAGGSIGNHARSLGAILASLPVLSSIGDTIRARHGIDQLAAVLAEDPRNPVPAVHLAEAMHRCESDMATYTKIRSMTSLTYAMRRQLITSTLELGTDAVDPVKTRLLKSAFGRTRKRLSSTPNDAEALDLTARIYLMTGHFSEAATTAKIAVSADPMYGNAWVTLARAYLSLGMAANAANAARIAVDLGAGYGHLLLASAELHDDNADASSAISRYESTKAKITDQDRLDYLGFVTDGRQVFDTILSNQGDKGRALMERWGMR